METSSSSSSSANIKHYFNITLPDTIKFIQQSKSLAGKHTSKQKVNELVKLYESTLPKLSEFISMIIAFVTQSNNTSDGVNNVIHYFKSGDDSDSFKLDWGAKDGSVKSGKSYLPNHNSIYLFFIIYSICNFGNFSHQFPLRHTSGTETTEKNFWTTLIVRLEEEAIGKMFPVSIGNQGKDGDFIYQTLFAHFKDDKQVKDIINYDSASGIGHVGNMAAINFIQSNIGLPSLVGKTVSIKTRQKTTAKGGSPKPHRIKNNKGRKTIRRKTIRRV